MKSESHKLLGQYLAGKYLNGLPRRHVRAFLLGCIEPDKNPTTYLKGSFRCQWLRGHNYNNAQRYMQKLCSGLEEKERLKLLDYYRLGKLIHYTTDAFTYSHNQFFQENLREHCSYERELSRYFRSYHCRIQTEQAPQALPAMDAIRSYHRSYASRPSGANTDTRYTVTVCTAVMARLLGVSAA